MFKRLFALVIAACLLATYVPAAASGTGESVVIKLAVDSPKASINGLESIIRKPYQLEGTTMVPLSVITKAFGAQLKLEDKKTITVSYNGTSVLFTIGSKHVKVNGVPAKLAVEPRIVNDVTMVPLRFIVSAFGAKLDWKGKQIMITGYKASGSADGSDPNRGKTWVGDSYLNWSAAYPSDFILADSTDIGDWMLWEDKKGESSLRIQVQEYDDSPRTKELLREDLIRYFYENEIALEQSTVQVDGLSFEKIISHNPIEGWFYEYRAIQKNAEIYYIIAGVKADSKDELDRMASYLDSFKPSFNKNDRSLQDIAKVKDGFIAFTDQEYGLSISLPLGWSRYDHWPNEASFPIFIDDISSQVSVNISALTDGATLEKHVARYRTYYEAHLAKDHARNFTTSDLKLTDGNAKVLTYEYTMDSKEWRREHIVFMIAGDFMYELYFTTPIDEHSDDLFARVMKSVDFDTDYIQEYFTRESGYDRTVDNGKMTGVSSKYGYSIAISNNWNGESVDWESNAVDFSTAWGMFSIRVLDRNEAEYIAGFEQAVTDGDGELIGNNEAVTINGQQWKKLTAHFTSEGGWSSVGERYILEKNGKVYALSFTIYDAYYSETNIALMNETIQSFIFTK